MIGTTETQRHRGHTEKNKKGENSRKKAQRAQRNSEVPFATFAHFCGHLFIRLLAALLLFSVTPLCLCVSVVLMWRVPAFAEGAKPEVKSVAPMGLRAGRTTQVVIYGENLTPKEITVKPPLTVKLGEVKA